MSYVICSIQLYMQMDMSMHVHVYMCTYVHVHGHVYMYTAMFPMQTSFRRLALLPPRCRSGAALSGCLEKTEGTVDSRRSEHGKIIGGLTPPLTSLLFFGVRGPSCPNLMASTVTRFALFGPFRLSELKARCQVPI